MKRRLLRNILMFLVGALILCLCSTIQKLISGYSIKLNGYIIPFIFGGISGFIISLFYNKLLKKTKQLGEINKKLEIMVELRTKELKDTIVNLKNSNATKDKFFSIIAHDLKTPFTSILGFSKLLNENFDKYNTQKQKHFIYIINQSVQNAYKLFENILLWSRSQRGLIDFNPEKENLYLLIIETIELLCQLAASKSIKLINQIPENIYVYADKDMLSTIIRNLISNAVKFTPKGGEITIKARTIKNKNKQHIVEINIKDNGVGILPETQSKLFRITENISTQGTEKEQGTGLGLILCKEFVEKHGGEIWVESEVGNLPAGLPCLPNRHGKAGGSEFIFTIPLFVKKMNTNGL